MALTVAYLGPLGTNSETVAVQYGQPIETQSGQIVDYVPCASIGKTVETVRQKLADVAIVPVENSTEGSVAITLDSLWMAETLQIQQALVLPIVHCLVSCSRTWPPSNGYYPIPKHWGNANGGSRHTCRMHRFYAVIPHPKRFNEYKMIPRQRRSPPPGCQFI